MINKQAIKELKILKEDYWDDDGYGHETKQYDDTILALDMAIQALEQTTWIPKSEKLPKEGEDVLACFYTSEGDYKMMVSRRSDYNYWKGVGRTGDMVAWMPLPPCYEPQKGAIRNDSKTTDTRFNLLSHERRNNRFL